MPSSAVITLFNSFPLLLTQGNESREKPMKEEEDRKEEDRKEEEEEGEEEGERQRRHGFRGGLFTIEELLR